MNTKSVARLFTIKLKYVISIILSYIYIVSISIGYVIKENEIVKNDKTGPKRTLEGEFLNGSVLQFSVPKLKIWKKSQLMSTISTLILLGRQKLKIVNQHTHVFIKHEIWRGNVMTYSNSTCHWKHISYVSIKVHFFPK
jgi:hypothetical protein